MNNIENLGKNESQVPFSEFLLQFGYFDAVFFGTMEALSLPLLFTE